MNSRTIVLTLPKAQHEVFSYLSNVENLPDWATEFCRQLKNDRGIYKVVTCDPDAPELLFQIKSDRQTGVIDMYAGPTEDQLDVFPVRVVRLSGHSSAILFTMFQWPQLSDTKFQSQYESLLREMENLRSRFQE